MNLNKAFIITIDTEADNQWDYDAPIKTENIKYLPRFQELSEKYGFKPVWLTNYEMAEDPHFVEYMREKQDKGLCEIGMHLHAWNTPPESPLNRSVRERDYLIEYPVDVMEKKIATMTETLEKNFGRAPVSHRSGRWTTLGFCTNSATKSTVPSRRTLTGRTNQDQPAKWGTTIPNAPKSPITFSRTS